MSSPQQAAVSCKWFQTSEKTRRKTCDKNKELTEECQPGTPWFYRLHKVYSSSLLNLWLTYLILHSIYSCMGAHSTSDSHIWCHFQTPSWPVAPAHPQLSRHHQGPSWPSKCRCRSGWSWGRLPLLRQTRLHPTSALLSTASSNTSTPNIHMPAHASSHSNTWTPTHLHRDHHIQTLQHPHTCTQKIITFKRFNTQHPHIEDRSPHSNISTPNTCTQKITFKCFNTQPPHTCTQITTFKPFNTHTPAHRSPHSNTSTPSHRPPHSNTSTPTHLHTGQHVGWCWRCHSGREHAEKGFRKNKDQSWKKGGPWSVIHFTWKYITKERLHCIFYQWYYCIFIRGSTVFLLKVLLYVCQRHPCIFITKATVFSSKVLLYFHQSYHCVFIKGATILSSKVPLFIKCATVFLPKVPPFIKCATVFLSMVPPYFRMHPSQY